MLYGAPLVLSLGTMVLQPVSKETILRGMVIICLETVISKRVMAPGIEGIEGSTHGHDVIPVKAAVKYLEARGYGNLEQYYQTFKATPHSYAYKGSSEKLGANRVVFGEAVNLVLDQFSPEENAKKVMVIDSGS